MKTSQFLLFLGLPLAFTYSQVGTWDRIPIATEIRDMAIIDDEFYLGTDGGVMHFNPEDRLFTISDLSGLLTNMDINALHLDDNGRIWVGNRAPGDITEVIDIQDETRFSLGQLDVTEILHFVAKGDSIFASYRSQLNGGILFYRNRIDDIQYLDLYDNFPASEVDLGDIRFLKIVGDRIVFGVPEGLFWAQITGTNLKDPNTWNFVASPLEDLDVGAALVLEDSLLVGIGYYLYSYNFDSFTLHSTLSSRILNLKWQATPGEVLYALTTSRLSSLDFRIPGATTDIHVEEDLTNLWIHDGKLWLSSSRSFLLALDEDVARSYLPNMPLNRIFTRMLVSPGGELYTGAKEGFGIKEQEGWWNIVGGDEHHVHDPQDWDWASLHRDTLEYPGNRIVEDMAFDRQDRIYASIQGRGVLRIDPTDLNASVFFDTTEGVMEPTFNSDVFVLPEDMALDQMGNMWLTMKFGRVGQPILTIITPEDEVHHISHNQNGLDSRAPVSIAVDAQNRIWLGTQIWEEVQSTGGLYVINYGNDISNVEQFQLASIKGTPLESTDIIRLQVDAENQLWVLTPGGVQSMPLPTDWLGTNDLRDWARAYMSASYWELGDYQITGMEIDQRGNRWFLSNNAGVHVLQTNGVWMNGGYGFHTGNSEILDDQVYSVAFNAMEGLAYISTSKGLSLFNTPFANPRENYETIFVYPQPFDPVKHGELVIQGLMDNSTVKILSISGKVIRELDAFTGGVQGFEAHWDGRDKAGDIVGNGVYILFFYNEDGNSASQKVAVLRD